MTQRTFKRTNKLGIEEEEGILVSLKKSLNFGLLNKRNAGNITKSRAN
jgi:hypothetical protein